MRKCGQGQNFLQAVEPESIPVTVNIGRVILIHKIRLTIQPIDCSIDQAIKISSGPKRGINRDPTLNLVTCALGLRSSNKEKQ
jgi:hypothetical protein